MDRFSFPRELKSYECNQCGCYVSLEDAYHYDTSDELVLCDEYCATEYLVENAEKYVEKLFGG